MALADTIEASADLPLDESMPMVANILRQERVVVPLANRPVAADSDLEMFMAIDNEGMAWIYVYSSEREAKAAGLGDYFMARLAFQQLIDMAERTGCGGIIIDGHKTRGTYPVPAAVFAKMIELMAAPG